MDGKTPLVILSQTEDPFVLRLERWLETRCPYVSLLPKYQAEKAEIAVFSPYLNALPQLSFATEPYLIFRSDSKSAAEFAASGRFRLLDYGFSLRDSLTFSSVSEKQAVIALQRPLALRLGELVEPMEFAVQLTEKPDADVLLAAAAICLLGKRMECLASFP